MPAAQQFRPKRITPKPFVQGPQTAIVVGPGGEEIYTDKYGRVKVQFHWDRRGKKDENSSCWIRVSQPWAGKNWGAIATPRIGQEVIVDFLEGDPGSADHHRPRLQRRADAAVRPAGEQDADRASRAAARKGGGPANFNEIRFEDKKGSEQLFIHAEKNQDIEVENDETHWVGHDRKKTIDHDETTPRQARPDRDGRQQRDDHGSWAAHGDRRQERDDHDSHEPDRCRWTRTRRLTVGAASGRTPSASTRRSPSAAAQEITVGAAQTVTVGAIQAISVGASQTTSVGAGQTNSDWRGSVEHDRRCPDDERRGGPIDQCWRRPDY